MFQHVSQLSKDLCFVELLQEFIPFLSKYFIGLQEFDTAEGIFFSCLLNSIIHVNVTVSLNKPLIKEKHYVIGALTNNDLK